MKMTGKFTIMEEWQYAIVLIKMENIWFKNK